MPRVELRCRDKSCLLLGGHRTATNAIMVWCTCSERDSMHPDSSRLMALDAWVVEHCRDESLGDYEEADEEEDESSDWLDRLCMSEALVVRAGLNRLAKPIPLRQLLSTTLVAQGGGKGLKGAPLWVYWYDQPIPTPSSSEYRGLGRIWAPGPLTRPDLGIWYRARITHCDTATGAVQIRYDVDGNEDSMYLLVAFAHFDAEPPTRGSQPEVLPHRDLMQYLGLPPSAAGSASTWAGARAKNRRDAAAAAAAAKKPAAAAPATGAGEPLPGKKDVAKGGRHEKQLAFAAAAAAAVDSEPSSSKSASMVAAAAPPPPAGGSLPLAPSLASAVAQPTAEANGGGGGSAGAKPLPSKVKPPAKRLSSPSAAAAAPRPPKHPAPKPTAPQAPAAAPPPPQAAGPSLRPGPAEAAAPIGRPAKRVRHEFEAVPLASATAGCGGGSGGADVPWPPAPLDSAEWAEREQRAAGGSSGGVRRGFRGFLCGRQEQVPVPVFNEVDAALPPPPAEYLSATAFEGRLATELAEAGGRRPEVAEALEELQALCDAAQPRWGQPCGRSYHEAVRQREARLAEAAAAASYGPDGRLLAVRPLGVHECSTFCCGGSPLCRSNMQLARGVRHPLEVFRVRGLPGGRVGGGPNRWSLRCAEPLEAGDFVAPLLGRLVPAQQLLEEVTAAAGRGDGGGGGGGGAGSERLLPGPPDVVLLNHFFGLWEAVYARGLLWCDQHVRMWQLPPNPLASKLRCFSGGGGGISPPASRRGSSGGGAAAAASPNGDDADPARPAVRRLSCMLALDTRNVGNVGRFVRQWTRLTADGTAGGMAAVDAGPALVVQPVLSGGCRTPLLYYVGLFAARRVEAGEELTCDWSSMALAGAGAGGVAGPAR